MDLTTLFPQSHQLRRKALAGPIGLYLSGFLDWASRVGYTRHSLYDLVRGAMEYSCYLAHQRQIDIQRLSDRHVRDFVASTPLRFVHGKYPTHVSRAARAAPHVLRYLRQLGVVPSEVAPPQRLYHGLLQEWLSFLRQHRGLTEGSVDLYRRHIARFLESLGPLATATLLHEVTVEHIRSYLHSRASRYGRSERKAMVSTLRQFLGFAWEHGYIEYDLRLAVETIRSFKQERLPRGPAWQDALSLLKTPKRNTGQGRRDYAILLILLTYGIRASQVVAMRLEDIKWRAAKIRFRAAKGGRPTEVPLAQPVGEALLEYLKESRPAVRERCLFLTLCAPIGPLAAGSITNIVRRAFDLAAVQTPHRGSHSLRHAWATQMLSEGRSLKMIADLLGHRQLETTRIYTKVDFAQLAQVALPWPSSIEVTP